MASSANPTRLSGRTVVLVSAGVRQRTRTILSSIRLLSSLRCGRLQDTQRYDKRLMRATSVFGVGIVVRQRDFTARPLWRWEQVSRRDGGACPYGCFDLVC